MAETETVSGTVTALNDNGFKLDGGDEWINFSKNYFKGPKPNRGDRVSARCQPWEGKLWASSVKVVQAAPSSNGGGQGGAQNRSIERSVCLKAAVDMAVANLAAVTSKGEDWTPWTLEPSHIRNVAEQLMEFFASEPKPAPEQEPEPAPPEDRGEP